MEHFRWLDQVVEQVAAMGSTSAGNLLIENAVEFFDHTESFKDKVDYVGGLVSYLNSSDRELENLELVESLCNSLRSISEHVEAEDRIRIPNQLNRLYYGIYTTTKDGKWLEKAIDELREVLRISECKGYLHYNLALCLRARGEDGDVDLALTHALRCIELDGEDTDTDHIELACTLMHTLNDERLSEYLDLLEQVNPIKAELLRSEWRSSCIDVKKMHW
jgi:tetratricopeptide (TPR) repeat protein